MAVGSGFGERAQAQDFPYAVPQAPEFDDRGTPGPVQSTDTESATPPRQVRRSNFPHAVEVRSDPENRVDYRAVRPYAPRTGPRSAAVPSTTGQLDYSSPPQAQYPTQASTRPPSRRSNPQQPAQPPPAEAQGPQPGQLDCSRFPQVIAQARSEGEMQLAAREYLTCLLQSGWNQDMARKHVITTIETAFKLAR